jgi:hypothetical protein
MRDDEFEWDDRKAAANLRTHGVSFKAARLAFDDAFAVEREDRREDYGEDRYALLGMFSAVFLLRLAARGFLGLLFQEPPRPTRPQEAVQASASRLMRALILRRRASAVSKDGRRH